MVAIHSAQQCLQRLFIGLIVHTADVVHRTVCNSHFLRPVRNCQCSFLGIILGIDTINFHIVEAILQDRFVTHTECVIADIAGNIKIEAHRNLGIIDQRCTVKTNTGNLTGYHIVGVDFRNCYSFSRFITCIGKGICMVVKIDLSACAVIQSSFCKCLQLFIIIALN